MKKRKKGALTLEAAISLPVFIFSILTLSYMIQTYYIHNTIDAAAATVLQDIAGKTFYLDQLGILYAGDRIEERTKKTNETLEATIEKTKSTFSDAKDFKNSITDFDYGQAAKEFIGIWKRGNVFSIISGLFDFKKNMTAEIKGSYEKIKKGKADIQEIYGNAKTIASDSKGLGISIASRGASKGLQYIMGRYVLTEIRGQLGNRAELYRIRKIELDMGENGLFYKDEDSGLNRLITVNIKYTVGIPLFIAPEVEIDKTVRKTIRAWVGE